MRLLTSESFPQSFRGLFVLMMILSFNLCAAGKTTAFGAFQGESAEIRAEARAHYKKGLSLRAEGDLAAADRSFILARDRYRQLEDWNTVVSCAIYRSQLNYELNRLDSLSLILAVAQDIIDRQTLKDEHFKQERIFFFRALYFEKTAQYQAAADMLDRATAILANLGELIGLDSAYISSHQSLAGSIYYERRDYEMAINHYQAALEWFPDSRPDEEKYLVINNNLGLAFIEMGAVNSGMSYLDRSLSILPQLDRETAYEDYLQTYFNLIRAYLLQEKRTEAQYYLKLADRILKRHPRDRHIWYSLSAQLQEQQGLKAQALQNYQSAFDARIAIRGRQHPSVAKLQLSIGKLQLSTGETNGALRAFQKGLQVFDQHLDSTSYFDLPQIRRVSDYYLLIQLLNERGTVLMRRNPEQARATLPTFRLAIQAIDSLRLLYESDASKLLLSKDAKSVFAGALTLLHQLYQAQPDTSLIEEAFRYMEKSKALLLLEHIRKWRDIRLQQSSSEASADRFGELLEKEKNAKLDLILIQRTIEDLAKGQEGQTTRQRENLERERQRVSSAYQRIKKVLSDSFPQYYQASYGDQLANMDQLRQGLMPEGRTALVSYFIFGHQSFAMLIVRNKVIFRKLPALDNWEQDFVAYRQALRTQGNRLLQTEIYQTYLTSASRLYDILLKDLLSGISRDIESLYLIPDDILGFLAFESLLPNLPAHNKVSYHLDDQDYLLEHYALAYGYSATLLLESLDKKVDDDDRSDYGGFAPVFQEGATGRAISRDCTTGSLMYLPYSKKSVEATEGLLQGKAFLHQEASLDNFKAAAGKYRILQLATHACVDQRDALFNVIYFHDTTLATYEIFDIPIRADLIVLSACETGSGDLMKGEGIMSLSRGFYYAGSANIVTSLWPADDFATQALMVRFHQLLSEGLPKAQALQEAKLSYLRSPEIRKLSAAPAFWANFILIGNQEAIDLDARAWNVWQLLLLPFLGLSLIIALLYGLKWRR